MIPDGNSEMAETTKSRERAKILRYLNKCGFYKMLEGQNRLK